MSQTLTIEMNDDTFQAVRRQAEAAGLPPERWLAQSLERQFVSHPKSEKQSPPRFESLFGSVDLGQSTDCDNEAIDADLGREYSATHEAI